MDNGTEDGAAGADVYTALAVELGRIGRRLDGMGAELLRLRTSGGPRVADPVGPVSTATWSPPRTAGSAPWASAATGYGPTWPPPGSGPWAPPAATGRGSAGSLPAGSTAPYAASAGWPAQQPPGPGPQPPSGAHAPVSQSPGPWAPAGPGLPPAGGHAAAGRPSSALTGARVLAWTGGAVTLLGVVLLLALVASRGWFTPPARVSVGGVLGLALLGVGLVLHRRASARIGAGALVATGCAALYLTVAAATSLYHYLPSAIALVLALAVAAAGLGVADRWRSELLAGGVTVGAAILAPVLSDGWLLVALTLALQLATLPVVLRRTWPVLLLLGAAGPALYGAIVVVGDERTGVVAGLAAAAVAVGLGVAGAARSAPAGRRAIVVAGAALPGVLGAGAVGGTPGALIAAVLAAVLAAFASVPQMPNAVRVAAGVSALVAVQVAIAAGLHGTGRATVAVLGEALVAAAVAVALHSRFAVVTGLSLGGIGLLAALARELSPGSLVQFGRGVYFVDGTAQVGAIVTGVVVSLLILATATLLLVAAGRRGWTRPDAASAGVWVPLGLAGLYGAAGLVMALAILVAPTPDGFRAGHVVITVSWTVAALVLLAQGLRRPALRIAGLVLVAAAVAKLVLFDLVALDGIARVVVFLSAGLVLLAAGTRYARMVAEADTEAEHDTGVRTTSTSTEPPNG